MERTEPKYYSYNNDFAQNYGIILSVLMGRIIYEMKLNLPQKEFIFDERKAAHIYTDEIYGEIDALRAYGLIEYQALENDRYLVRVTKKGILAYIFNCFDYKGE